MTEFLPGVSGGSLSEGVWFVFPDGARTIHAWGSNVTGLERIYVDGTNVSEHRSASRISRHEFDVDGESYSITFNTKGALRMELQCTLAKGDTPLRSITATFDRSSVTSPRRMLLGVFAGVLAGAAYVYFHFPLWVGVLLFIVIVAVQGATRKRNAGIKFQEVGAQQGAQADGPTSSGPPA
ncbi:MAG: hypothetical protein WC655_22965 [Candidatus Hydrogenedentales bacterium]|jgi:hypothetical protein